MTEKDSPIHMRAMTKKATITSWYIQHRHHSIPTYNHVR